MMKTAQTFNSGREAMMILSSAARKWIESSVKLLVKMLRWSNELKDLTTLIEWRLSRR